MQIPQQIEDENIPADVWRRVTELSGIHEDGRHYVTPSAAALARHVMQFEPLLPALERMIAAELSGVGAEICKARHHARDVAAKARGLA